MLQSPCLPDSFYFYFFAFCVLLGEHVDLEKRWELSLCQHECVPGALSDLVSISSCSKIQV